jgi:hypothetical protein
MNTDQAAEKSANAIPRVNEKNRKDEIYEAYKEVVSKLEAKGKKPESPAEAEKTAEKTKLLNKSKSYSPEAIKAELEQFKKELKENTANLAQSLISEFTRAGEELASELRRLEEVRKAIKIEEDNLERIYGIKSAAISLTEFLEVIEEQKEKWQQAKEQKQKEREREEEEYAYKLQKKRQQEEEEYRLQQKKVKELFEEDMQSRRQAIEQKEAELAASLEELESLRAFQAGAEADKQEAVAVAVSEREAQLKKELEAERHLRQSEAAAASQLLEQKVGYLEERIAEKDHYLRDLKAEAEEAERRAQELAIAVVKAGKEDQARSVAAETSKDYPAPGNNQQGSGH